MVKMFRNNTLKKCIVFLIIIVLSSVVVIYLHADNRRVEITADTNDGGRNAIDKPRETKSYLVNKSVVYDVDVLRAGLFKDNRRVEITADTNDGGRNAINKPRKTKSYLVNKSVVYDNDVLHAELLKVHSMMYDNKTGGECILRDPKCVVLGVSKSGTQELVDFASLHPNIVLKPGLSPPEMFHKDETTRRKGMIGNNKYPMPCSYADQIAIAKTDEYLFRPEMPQLLHTFNPDVKMILIVREPLERMISGFSFIYLQRIQHKERFTYKPEDVPEMDHWFVNRLNGQVIKSHELALSTYYVGHERYLKVFSKEQILIIESNELKNDPVRVLQKVERFLNIKPVFTDAFFTFVEEKGFYCLNADKIYCYGSNRGRAVKKELQPKTRTTLKSYFKPLNMKFFELIGRNFDW